MFGIDPASLRHVLEQLEQAGQDHASWQRSVARAIACRLPPDPHDLADDAHRECRFGQWYYLHPPVELRDHPAFAAMEAEHARMHRAAARLLRASVAGVPALPADFDEYLGASERLTFELDSLRHQIQGFLRSRDALTGAHRRLDLLAELHELRELSRRGIQTCCIAFMDVDRFKAINDAFGHHVGDRVLAGAVEFVMGHLRPFDKIFRYGGDEFLISLPGTDLATGRVAIERMREGLAALTPVRIGDTPVRMTASFGIALLDRDLGVEESIERADGALLAAKAAGRNRVCSWDPAATTGTTRMLFGPAREATD